MDEGFLRRYARQLPEPDPGNVVELDPCEDLGCFGWLRGIRDRCPMIEFRKRNGNILALGYAWLHRIDFDPSDGLTLWFASQKVSIRGQNLDAEVRPGVRLLDGLVRHRVPWVREAGPPEVEVSADGACLLEGMTWS